jgi:acyl-coenzyme A thioesterase 9
LEGNRNRISFRSFPKNNIIAKHHLIIISMLANIARRSKGGTPRLLHQIISSFDQTHSFSSAKHFLPHVLDEHDTIVGGYTPVTKKLWAQRYKWDTESLSSAQPQTAFLPKPSIKTEVPYPFSKDPVLREYFRNPWGGVRIGLLLEDMDSMAGFTAYQHVDDGDSTTRPPILVTATVEAIHFNPPPLHLEKDMKLSGRVVWTGKSSMDILIEVRQEKDGDENGSENITTKNSKKIKTKAAPNISALFTFVARDPITGKAHQISPVAPEDDTGKALFAKRQAISDARRAERKAEALAEHKYTAEQVAFTTDLLCHAHLKRDLPALANPSAIFMPQTTLENTFTTQPQQRNIHGRIFGGFLMRRAFELAHSTSYLLAASRPRTVVVDEIQFKRPVDVGDLLRFRSRVLKAWNDPEAVREAVPSRGFVHVQVVASVVKPEAVQSYETNTFNFVFEVQRRRKSGTNCSEKEYEGLVRSGESAVFEQEVLVPMPEILPTTEEEANEVCAFHGPGSEARRGRWFTPTM